MSRILLRHVSGMRANQVDEFPATANEILVGRDPIADVRFDPGRDDLVSRQHCRIVRDPANRDAFSVIDLQSRNGCFVNRQKIFNQTRLNHFDVIQLGPAGPEFRFELDPPPPGGAMRPTREADLNMRPTREAVGVGEFMSSSPRPVGRATVERMLGDTFGNLKRESNKTLWVGTAALAAVFVVGGGIYAYLRESSTENLQKTRQNQELIRAVGEEVKKAPEATEALKEQVNQLEGDLKKSEARNQENRLVLAQLLAMQRADLATRRAAGPAENPNSKGALQPQQAQQPAAQQPNSDYDNRVRAGVEQLRNGNATEALRLAAALIQSDPNNWQGYSLAGSALLAANRAEDSKAMLAKAMSLAPDSVKPELQRAIQQASGSAQ